MSIDSAIPSNHLAFCHPLLLLPSIFPNIRVFSNESVIHIRQPKYWSFSVSISPCNGYSEVISFRIEWFDLLAVQGTLKSLLQHCSCNASILQQSALFMVQLSHPYLTTRKTIVLTIKVFVSKVMSLLFNTLFVCHSFSSKEQPCLISWLQSPPTVIQEPKKIKSVTISIVFQLFAMK